MNPLSDDESSGATGSGQAPNQPRHAWLWAQVIGAATAIIAIAVAALYGLGAVSLGLMLWYVKDPVSPALAQLPREILIVHAFSGIIIPTIVTAVVGFVLYEVLHLSTRISSSPPARPRDAPPRAIDRLRITKDDGAPRFFRLIILAALLALVPLAILRHNYTFPVIRSFWEVYVACLLASLISVYIAVRLLSWDKRHERGAIGTGRLHETVRVGKRIGIATLALVPCVSFAAAAVPLPVVYLCGATFNHVDKFGRHYAVGNLIGTSGQYVYVAETRVLYLGTSVKPGYNGSYVAVVPLSAARLETIGQQAECNDLNPAPTTAIPQGTAQEANPIFAIDYATKSVGSCIERAFSRDHFNTSFVSYIGDGVVQFEVGSQADPLGDPAKSTTIYVQTYADGYVADNSALDFWGCQPSNGGIRPGYFVNGQPGMPHWFILLATGPGGDISGTIGYIKMGGQTGLAQTFTGRTQSGLATLTFSKAGFQTAIYGSGSIVLGSCTDWLKNVPNIRACTFTHSSGVR